MKQVKGEKAVLEFIQLTQEDSKVQKELENAYQSGANVTLDKITKIGAKAGFDFSTDEFRTTMRKIIRMRFMAGELALEDLVAADDPPESSCAWGCLSYTKTWHPSQRRVGIILPREMSGKI